jgi:hypothetical protein
MLVGEVYKSSGRFEEKIKKIMALFFVQIGILPRFKGR